MILLSVQQDNEYIWLDDKIYEEIKIWTLENKMGKIFLEDVGNLFEGQYVLGFIKFKNIQEANYFRLTIGQGLDTKEVKRDLSKYEERAI